MKIMSDNHYYGCCACIGSVGAGMISKMALLTTAKGIALNLFIPGRMQTTTESGNEIVFQTRTDYPKSGAIAITVEMKYEEELELLIRNPIWSEHTKLSVNGIEQNVTKGYISIERKWEKGDVVKLELDMRTRAVYPTPYGHDILMNRYVWGVDCMAPMYDIEDLLASKHIALLHGPIVLAQENRLGYSVDEPVCIRVNKDGYVDTAIPEREIAPYEHIIELEIPLTCGHTMHVTDYASAGKLWTDESKMAAWILTK